MTRNITTQYMALCCQPRKWYFSPFIVSVIWDFNKWYPIRKKQQRHNTWLPICHWIWHRYTHSHTYPACFVLFLFPTSSSLSTSSPRSSSHQSFSTSASVGRARWPALHCDVITLTFSWDMDQALVVTPPLGALTSIEQWRNNELPVEM